MSTLSGQRPRLAGYCDHKLPTSCRLTSLRNCCACADERAHAPSYPTYIDGVGFVPQGTRWQRYCWYCSKFWENRVAATNLRPQQTRIPDRPDLSEFLNRWYDFHRGHRIVRQADGSEIHVAVLGEPWSEVDPGCLPRTLDELRAGHLQSVFDQQQPQIALDDEDAAEVPSLEETLDNMLADADAEDSVYSIEDSAPPNRLLVDLTLSTTPHSMEDGEVRRRQSISQTRQQRRAARGYRQVWGTREETEADDYVSPIDRMFSRMESRRQAVADSQAAQSNSDEPEQLQNASVEEGAQPSDLHDPGDRWARTLSGWVGPIARPWERGEVPRPRGLDVDESRPEPKSDEDMTVRLDCKVCFTQMASTVFLPCGHMVMCKWCADMHCPSHDHDHTRPRKPTDCPLCRKAIKQKYAVKFG